MSTNISKKKRDDLLDKIKQIRAFIAAAPQDENTGNLLSYLSELEKDVNGKKYGLVFEEHREEIDEVLDTHTPVLTEDADLFIDHGGQMNFLLEGDNLAALKLLEKTHRGKIDLIYIDPPYNRGKTDFVYDDDFVVNEDTFRHSKWISFMKSRLEAAKRLLTEAGLVFISIDDNEVAALKLLCDEVFGADFFINLFVWQRNSSAKTEKGKFTVNTEYVLLYAKSGAYTLNSAYKPLSDASQKLFKFDDNDGRGISSGGSVLIYVPKSHIYSKSIYSEFDKYVKLCDKLEDPDALQMIDELRSYIGASKNNALFYNSEMLEKLSLGIVTHHGSMPLAARLILEHFTQSGFCRICFATSTLEQGINMPFDVVYLDKFEASKSLSVKNLIGRAGRSTVDTKFDYGSVVIRNNAITPFRRVMKKAEPLSKISNLDVTDDSLDEKYKEFKEAIKTGEFSDEYNLPSADVEKLHSEDVTAMIPQLLDMMFDNEKIISPDSDMKEVNDLFSKLYQQYFKYGTDKEREIWMLRYGFSFEETELVSECIDFIDETEIKFNDRINALNEAQLQVIEQYVHE